MTGFVIVALALLWATATVSAARWARTATVAEVEAALELSERRDPL